MCTIRNFYGDKLLTLNGTISWNSHAMKIAWCRHHEMCMKNRITRKYSELVNIAWKYSCTYSCCVPSAGHKPLYEPHYRPKVVVVTRVSPMVASFPTSLSVAAVSSPHPTFSMKEIRKSGTLHQKSRACWFSITRNLESQSVCSHLLITW